MDPQAVITLIISWLRTAVLLLLMVVLVVVILKAFGVAVPLRGLGHVELAYLCGAYWLTK